MRSQWWLLGIGLAGFGAAAVPLYLGVWAVASQLYAGPVAFGVGFSVYRVLSGTHKTDGGWIYHQNRPVQDRFLDYGVVVVITVPLTVGAALGADLAVGTLLTQETIVADPILLTEPVSIAVSLIASGTVFGVRRPDYEDTSTLASSDR